MYATIMLLSISLKKSSVISDENIVHNYFRMYTDKKINNISKTTLKSPHEIKTELVLKSSTVYTVVLIAFIQYSMQVDKTKLS